MPRYKLRTLLIVLTIFSLALARFAYLKRQRDYHRLEVQRLVVQLSAFRNFDQPDTVWLIRSVAAEGPGSRGSWVGGDLPGQYGSAEYESTLTNWHLARQHEILANRYARAIYCPWVSVWDDPNSVPDQVRWLDLRLATYSAVLALAMLAAWWWWPKTIVPRKATVDSAA